LHFFRRDTDLAPVWLIGGGDTQRQEMSEGIHGLGPFEPRRRLPRHSQHVGRFPASMALYGYQK
jgi:hypothetical protein